MKVSPAARVAAMATAVIAVVYIICVTVLSLVVSSHLTGQNDERLAGRLAIARHDRDALSQRVAPAGSGPGSEDGDVDGDSAPVFLWSANASGAITAHSPGAPALPAALLAGDTLREGFAKTVTLGSAGPFRLKMTRSGRGWLIAGQSLAGQAHTQRLLLTGEIIAGPFLLLAMFGGSLVVGLRALAPVEQSRRRQLEFTADASHELRTPLSVIRAEADVALSSPREAAGYRDALTRIQRESQRLRQLVEDMLWLARFDSNPPLPGNEPVDLATLAQACADRFRSVGPALTTDITAEPALISARQSGSTGWPACWWTTPAATRARTVRSGSGSGSKAAGSASSWRTPAPASPTPNGRACSTASTVPPTVPPTAAPTAAPTVPPTVPPTAAPAPASGWPSAIRSSARPADAGTSAIPR